MKLKKVIAITLAVGVISAMGIAYAVTTKTPADITASLTGKSIEEVTTEHNEGKTYGTIANDAGKLDEFKTQMLEQKKAILDQQVKDGKLTQEQADTIYNNIKNNQATCDGSGSARIGRQGGAGFGKGCGNGAGQGCGLGNRGRGNGQGLGRGR